MKKLLITGFNPFDERNYNTSSEVLPLLPAQIEDYQLIKKIIPVEWEQGRHTLLQHCQNEQPDAIFSMGMSKNSFLQFEVLARNYRKPELTDNLNAIPQSDIISNAAPATIPCNFPAPATLPCIFKNQLRMESSDDAGGYLCNQTFFLASEYAQGCAEIPLVAFVHIPPKPEDGGQELSAIAQAIEELIHSCFSK